ncbi:MAG: 50S ribosomal protein L27 [Candidatus Gribaldobacteria bacterium]|nr:50S ribosomal protein L27 [Candidatus Gribaldobacteria bacterium]
MAHTKAKGSTKLGRDSNPQYLGVKLYDGQVAKPGMIIIRQRGTKILAGKNVGCGTDHTLFAMKEGKIKFQTKNKVTFTGQKRKTKIVNVI